MGQRGVSFYPVDAQAPDRVAAIDDEGRSLTYGELSAICGRLGAVVEQRRVALVLSRNTIDCLSACVALVQNGVVPLLVDANSDAAAIERFVDLYRPEYVACPEDAAASLPGFAESFALGNYRLLVSTAPFADPVHEDLGLLMPTSGSTGSPKLVRQSRDNLRANGASIIEYLGIAADDRPVTSLPMHYTYGYSVVNSHLLVGATLLVTDRSVIEKGFWSFVDEQSATSLAGVPYTYQMLQRLRFSRMSLPALRTLTQAGGKMTPALITEFAQHAADTGRRFFVMYGQTEATARMSYVPSERALEKAGSIGIPIPRGEFFLVDADGAVIDEVGVEGELGYRGPNVTMGYAQSRDDLTTGDERSGSLLTGDVAYRDAEGYYYITGRRNRYVKVFGKRVSLDDVEQMAHTVVSEVACLGVDDEVQVWITDEAAAAALKQSLAERTAIHPSAFKVRVTHDLPRTSAGKVDYRALAERQDS